MREDGFYWVRYKWDMRNVWIVAEYRRGRWWLTSRTSDSVDSDFSEIDERKIQR